MVRLEREGGEEREEREWREGERVERVERERRERGRGERGERGEREGGGERERGREVELNISYYSSFPMNTHTSPIPMYTRTHTCTT